MKNNFVKAACIAMTIAALPAEAISLATGFAPWNVNGSAVVVENSLPSNWVSGTWVGATADDASIGNAAGTYIYTLAIGLWASGPGSFSMTYAADNSITWSISGGGSLGPGTSVCAGNCFSTADGAPFSLNGTFSATSILTGTVINTTAGSTGIVANATASNPTGLTAAGNASGIPEPSPWALLLGGAAILAVARRGRVT